MPKSPAKSYPSRTVEAGQTVYRRGDLGDCMYLIQTGSVEVREAQGPGRAAEPTVLKRGDFFGEMAVLGEDVRTHEVQARIDTRLIEIDSRRFSSLLKRNTEITVRMIRKLARRIAHHEQLLIRTWEESHRGAAGPAPAPTPAVFGGDATINSLPPAARLVHLEGEREGIAFDLPLQDEISIGRVDPLNQVHPDIDLTEVDVQLSTSRRHAQIMRRGASLLLTEVRSTNGTFVDGRRLDAESPRVLRGGEEIRFGGVRMRFVLDARTNRGPTSAVPSGTANAGAEPEPSES